MVKQLTLILISLFLCKASVFAQVVEWSNQQKLKSKSNFTEIIGENASGLYMLRGKNFDLASELIIEKYKSNLSLEKSETFIQPHNSDVVSALLLPDGLLFIATKRNDSLPKIDIISWKLDNQLQKAGPIKVLAQVDNALFKNNDAVYVKGSANGNNFSLVYLTEGLEKNNTTIHLLGFNPAMNLLFQKQFPVPHPPDDIVISGFECDNEGNSFALIDFPRTAEKKKKGKLRTFFLYGYYQSLDKILEYELTQDSLTINDLALAVNNYKKVVNVAGFYATGENTNEAAGSFVYCIDAVSTLTLYKKYEPMNKSFETKVIGMMRNETGSHLTDLYIRKLIPRSDGGVTMIAEKYYETRQTYTYYANGFPQTASRVTYNYDEIVVLSKNGDGVTQYNEFIKKAQSSIGDGGYYSSFMLLNATNKLSFVYNENASEESDVMISTLNPLGQLETRILIKALSYYVQLMPMESKQINANSSIICTLKDRRFTLMKLTN